MNRRTETNLDSSFLLVVLLRRTDTLARSLLVKTESLHTNHSMYSLDQLTSSPSLERVGPPRSAARA